MKCCFPECSLDCINCPEYKENNTVKDELLDYVQSIEADNYLCSIEAHEERFVDSFLPY